MSFNKFREAAGRAPPPGKGGFKKEPWGMENFEMQSSEGAIIRALQPEGAIYSFYTHWAGKPYTCPADLPVFKDRCVHCFYYHQGEQAAKKLGKGPDGKDAKNQYDGLWRRMNYLLEVLDYRYFHVGPEDAKGRPTLLRCANDEAKPQRVRCPLCQKNEPRIFGGHKQWELPPAQLKALMLVDAQIGERCIGQIGGPACDRKITLVGFGCPEGHELLGEADLTDATGATIQKGLLSMTPEEVNAYVITPQVCGVCGIETLPQDILVADESCPSCGGMAPVRSTIFHKNLDVTCVGTRDAAGKTKKSYQFDRSQPFSDPLQDLLQHVPEDFARELLKPWDLAFRHRPMWLNRDKFQNDEEYVTAVLDKQAAAIGQPNPYKAQQQTTAYQGNASFRGR